MKRIVVFAAAMAVVGSMTAGDALARGVGGGGRGGGGGALGGGGYSAAARLSPAAGRTPTMTRSVPAARPATIAARPASGPGAAGRPALPSEVPFQRPTSQQLGNFLNLPSQQSAGSFARGSTLPAGTQQKTVETPRGGEITVTRGAGSKTTAGGATVGGAGRAVTVETAGGASKTRVSGAVGATDGTRSAAARGTAVGVKGPGGQTRAAARGTSVRTDGTHTVVKQGAAVRGPGGNVVTAGRGAAFANGQFVGGATWSKVNGTYRHWNAFGPGWHTRYPAAWWPGKWAVRATAWAATTWALAGTYCGCSGDGAYYDYSENVYYEEGNVYYGDQVVGTEEEYYDQAVQIAASGQDTQNEDWLPLGVFAVVSEGQTETDKVLQLAVNKQGVIRGNYQDFLTDKVFPVSGAVDKKTQRVAIKLEGNDRVVIETGLYNLTNDEVPVLIHIGKDRQEKRLLVRLQQPQEAGAENQP